MRSSVAVQFGRIGSEHPGDALDRRRRVRLALDDGRDPVRERPVAGGAVAGGDVGRARLDVLGGEASVRVLQPGRDRRIVADVEEREDAGRFSHTTECG
ncbi:hypothetical protein [Natronomonas moolapensis]|uniref:hypothetical protein n=1 Tax=Natronomonas moolapensis TaxID=416273 RepID=UPI000677B9F7|nr:hypothetical protein [Natronomonas moolapensis]